MRWKPALVLIGVLLLGAAAGALSDRAYLAYLESRKPGGARAVRSPASVLDLWTEKFDLTPEQRAKILPILKAYRVNRWKQLQKNIDELEKFIADLMRQVRPTLNPDQLERYDRFWRRFSELRRRGRERRFGKPPPP
ncbi:hypothetical protein ACFLQ0_02545 [Nitrospinota bacterium]